MSVWKNDLPLAYVVNGYFPEPLDSNTKARLRARNEEQMGITPNARTHAKISGGIQNSEKKGDDEIPGNETFFYLYTITR